MQALLDAAGLKSVPLLDGGAGMALWIPLADAPYAQPLRRWLRGFANHAAAKHPDLISTEFNTHHDGRVHVHASSNAAGHYSAVPYALRAPGLTVCTPIRWAELDGFASAAAIGTGDLAERLEKYGQPSPNKSKPSGTKPFARDRRSPCHQASTPIHITAAPSKFSATKAATADDPLAQALAQASPAANDAQIRLFSPHRVHRAQLGRAGNRPSSRCAASFRINEPADDWPDIVPVSQPAGDEASRALAERLEATSTATDPAAFEAAVCDVFAHLGFLRSTSAPTASPTGLRTQFSDGAAIVSWSNVRPLKKIVPRPDVAEAAKFREAFGADRCALVGPMFSDETELLDELQTHGVTALTVPDLQTLLHIAADAVELERVLVPGYASAYLPASSGSALTAPQNAWRPLQDLSRARVGACRGMPPNNAPGTTRPS